MNAFTSSTPASSTPAPLAGVLASLALSTLLPALAISSANVALPTLAVHFRVDLAAASWVVLAYLLATTTLLVGAGRLGDLMGRRRVLLAGVALFGAASGLCALAPSWPMLLVARALQGVGAAAMLALTMAMVGASLPKARSGQAMGMLGTMSAVGTALGPSLGGVLIDTFGWQAVFAVNVPLSLAALVLARRYLPGDAQRAGVSGFDAHGMVWLAIVLAGYALAMTRHPGWLAVAIAALLMLVRAERRAASPLLPLARLREPALRTSLVMNALVSAVMMATLVVGPFHLTAVSGLAASAVGGLMSVGPVVSAFSGVPAGRLVDRFGAPTMVLVGLALMALGCALIAALPPSLGVLGYVGPLVIVTPGYALFQAANNTAVMAGVDAAQRGVVAGLLTLSRNLGLITGASAMAALFAAGGLQLSFIVACAMIACAFGLASRGRCTAQAAFTRGPWLAPTLRSPP